MQYMVVELSGVTCKASHWVQANTRGPGPPLRWIGSPYCSQLGLRRQGHQSTARVLLYLTALSHHSASLRSTSFVIPIWTLHPASARSLPLPPCQFYRIAAAVGLTVNKISLSKLIQFVFTCNKCLYGHPWGQFFLQMLVVLSSMLLWSRFRPGYS